jgi:hypothetical protein
MEREVRRVAGGVNVWTRTLPPWSFTVTRPAWVVEPSAVPSVVALEFAGSEPLRSPQFLQRRRSRVAQRDLAPSVRATALAASPLVTPSG